ncbi:MAG: HD-GYP domain-containing protein [Candidatus Omnitrophota bacterium]
MKKLIIRFSRFFRSFSIKVALAFIISMLFVGALNIFLIYRFSLNSQFNDLRNKLQIIAQTSALLVDADMLTRIPLNRAGIDTVEFKTISDKLKKIREINPPIKYIYTLTKTEEEGVWQFIIDVDLFSRSAKRKNQTAYPGDKYDASRFPEMLKGFERPSADKKLEADEWGVTLSGYAPIRDQNGKSVAVLGVDIMADDVCAIQREVHRRAFLVLTLGIILSILLGLLISRRISNPIRKLVEGTHRIGRGQMGYRIEIKGNDEISGLARSFNRMARTLSRSRERLVSYFYDVVQSLVRILEAKDHYTRGHSERVAGYAEKIAFKMGFSPEKVELLKEITLLHDIGKIGIQEGILNKKEKLTEQDWEEIHKHPVVGEDILKPIFLSEEMLEIVRSHHERYDGKGYPDKIKGKDISTFAAIVSVADAYDAMTSFRAYRPALSKEEAVRELKENKGSQFNSHVVDVFIQILG